MRASSPLGGVAALAMALAMAPVVVTGQESFEYGFEGPDTLCGVPGTTLTVPYYCTLRTTGPDVLARGWSFGVRAENAAIRCITTAGTAFEEYTDGSGFSKSEITTGEGNEGAVSIIVLSQFEPITLPPESTSRVAVLAVEAVIADDTSTATLEYVDGLIGTGVGIRVSVTDQELLEHVPPLLPQTITLNPNTVGPCDEVNSVGWIMTAGWNLLFPLGNPSGCQAGGEANMLRNWVAPHDLLSEAPAVGEEWNDIDFNGAAASSGFEAAELYEALGLSGEPIWVSTAHLAGLTGGELPNRNLVDFQQLVDVLNADVVPPLGIRPIFSDNVLAVAQTYVQNTTDAAICLDVCTASYDSLQVWVGDRLVTNQSRCGFICADCSEKNRVILEPGINKITALCWEERGSWGFKLSLEDPETGVKLTHSNQTDIVFLGAEPGNPPPAPAQLVVTRVTSNLDSCPVDSQRVTLLGNGQGSGNVSITETYRALNLTAESFSSISDGGVVTAIDEGNLGYPQFFRISWDVSVDVLNSTGVQYDIELPSGTTESPTGVVNDCALVGGVPTVEGPRTHTGPLGDFVDSHDIGIPRDLTGPPGSLVMETDPLGYSIQGSGKGLGDRGDSFHFGYKRLTGDFSATVRIADRVFPDSGGREAAYGIMARQDCSSDSRYSMILANLEADPGPDSDHPRGDAVFYKFRWQHQVSGTTDASQSVVFPDPDGDGPAIENQPNYFRLDRRGEILSGYASFDGEAWRFVGSKAWDGLGPDDEILVGFAYTKGGSGQTSGTINFTDFSCVPPPPVEIFDNDDGGTGEIVYESDLDKVPDGTLPPEIVGNSGGTGGGAGGGSGFSPVTMGGRLRLTEEGIFNTATSAFIDIPVPIGTGQIVVEYTLWVTHSGVTEQPVTGDPNPGHGVTCTVLAGTDTSRVGGSGEDLGYGGIALSLEGAAPSVAVESDTWSGSAFSEGTGSPANDGTWHLGINSGGNVFSLALNNSELPDIFAPEGVRHRVVINSDGRVSVFLLPGGDGAGAGDGGTPIAEAQTDPLGSQGDTEATLGFTGATGSEGTQTSEVGDIEVTIIECSDTQETATISGPTEALAGETVVLDASASNAGVGDEAETLTFEWEVSGSAQIVGPNDGPTVSIIVDDGEAVGRVRINDGHCDNAVVAEHNITGMPANNWITYDANHDGVVNITDPSFHLNFMFLGGPRPECLEATDFDNDGKQLITDPIAALNHLFMGGPPPERGTGCQSYPSCGYSDDCP